MMMTILKPQSPTCWRVEVPSYEELSVSELLTLIQVDGKPETELVGGDDRDDGVVYRRRAAVRR